MVISELVKLGRDILKNSNIENPNLEARLILANSILKDKEYVTCNISEEVSYECELKYRNHLKERINGKPIQHILGKKEFMKLDFIVNENVLIPRADTEILVEEAIDICNGFKHDIKVLDLCTGSGAIAVSIAKYVENCIVYGTDISEMALEVAKQNAIENNVFSKIVFKHADVFNEYIKNVKQVDDLVEFDLESQKFDVILSNPPYIKYSEIEKLSNEVKNEPMLALDGGKDGLKFYKEIAKNLNKFLKPNGYIIFEIGYDQREYVINILEDIGIFSEIYCKQDLAKNDRVIVGKGKY